MRLRGDRYWSERLQAVAQLESSLHLAILVEPYLEYILAGKKTVESRFSKRSVAPFGCVRRGDTVALKRAAGPIVAVCEIGSTWEYRLTPAIVSDLRNRFGRALCAMDPAFWEARRDARFLTLMQVERVARIEPLLVGKTDRRGWVVVSRAKPDLLWNER
jgi:hypothetical protein